MQEINLTEILNVDDEIYELIDNRKVKVADINLNSEFPILVKGLANANKRH